MLDKFKVLDMSFRKLDWYDHYIWKNGVKSGPALDVYALNVK